MIVLEEPAVEEVENLGSRAINYGARVNVGSLQDTLARLVELDHKIPVEPKDESYDRKSTERGKAVSRAQ